MAATVEVVGFNDEVAANRQRLEQAAARAEQAQQAYKQELQDLWLDVCTYRRERLQSPPEIVVEASTVRDRLRGRYIRTPGLHRGPPEPRAGALLYPPGVLTLVPPGGLLHFGFPVTPRLTGTGALWFHVERRIYDTNFQSLICLPHGPILIDKNPLRDIVAQTLAGSR